MKNNALFEILATFSIKEWEVLKAHISKSSANVKHQQLIQLLDQPIKKKSLEQVRKKDLLKHLFVNAVQGENHLRVVLHQFTKVVEDFLIAQELEEQTHYKNHLLRNVYIKRGLKKRFERHLKKSKNKIEKKKGLETYHDQYLLAADYCEFSQITRSRTIEKAPMEEAIQQLDHYYLTHRYQLMIGVLSLQVLYQHESSLPLLTPLLNLGECVNTTQNNTLLRLYHTIISLLAHPESTIDFSILQTELEQATSKIPVKELDLLYTALINFYIRKSNYGESQYDKVFELYQSMVNHGVLAINGHLPEGKYKNIVTLGCLFKQFDWTLQFIENYKKRIEKHKRTSVYHFNLGAFFFYQNDFETAQKHLIKVDNLDIYYMVDVRSLLIRIFYETDQLYAAEQYLRSFRDFVRKNKVLKADFKKAYINFINLLGSLIKHKETYGDKEKVKTKLNDKLMAFPVVHHKAWLSSKIGAL